MEVSFKAHLINKCTIQKYSKNTRSFLPAEVSFVELDGKNWRDRRALKKISRTWRETFASDIYKRKRKNNDLKVFAITEQNSNFDKIVAGEVLGLTQINNIEPNVHYIDYLQTRTEYTMGKSARKYKGIGSKILDNLKMLFKKDMLKLVSILDDDVIEFYLKNNFKFENFYLGDLIWVDKFEKQ